MANQKMKISELADQNIISRKPYQGINALLLGSSDFKSPFWLSFKAGNPIVREDGKPGRIPFVRWANVFNLDQTEGIQAPAIAAAQSASQPLEKAAAIVENAKLCPIHHAGFAASYSPVDDVIRIPAPSTFHSQEDYFHTLYHEMIHNAEPGIMPHGAGRRRL
jgi:antirestriction protein ArdC